MFFQLNELLRWLGLTAFEIFTALLCFLVFTVLVTLKVRGRVMTRRIHASSHIYLRK